MDDSTLYALAENKCLQLNPNQHELLRSRCQVALLQVAENQTAKDSTGPYAKAWLKRLNRLKEYLKQHPDKTMPEFQFLTPARWFNAVEDVSGPLTKDVTNLDRYVHAPIGFLRTMAEYDFGVRIQVALQKYGAANDGQFPTDLSQLQPYCDPKMGALLQQLYEIKPASILPVSQVNAMNIKTDWVIAGKEPVASNTANHIAIYASGYTYFW